MMYSLFVIFVLLVVLTVVVAQEKPNPLFTSRQFEPAALFRQNICALQERFHNRTLLLENALRGLELRPYFIESEFFHLNPETGAIDESYPGLTAVMLDKLAERAGFTWRNSFAVTGEVPEGNHTWTELLQWSVDAYDVSIDWWSFSIERVGAGITFPEGWYDGTIIMIANTGQSSDKDQFNFWAWLRPFDNGVWWLIVLTLVFSGFVYWILENIDQHSDKQRLEQNLLENVWLSAISFTTHFEFRPRTNAARLFTLSLSFWAMLMASAYTANLASFLVVSNASQLKIGSVSDAVRFGVPMCVQRSTQADVAVTKVFPNAVFVRKDNQKDIYQGITTGECTVALGTVSGWDFWRRDVSVNPRCNLHWIGRPFKSIAAGFATISDSGTYCTSLITDVLNLHMLRLKDEGFVDEAWEQYLSRGATLNCATSETDDADSIENSQLKIQNMGGIFFFHGLLSFMAIIVAAVYHMTGWDKIPRFAKEGPLSRQAVRQSLAMPKSIPNHAPIPKPQKALLREASKKTFTEHIALRSSLLREKSRRNLFSSSETQAIAEMPRKSARNLFGLYHSDGALPSNRNINSAGLSSDSGTPNTRRRFLKNCNFPLGTERSRKPEEALPDAVGSDGSSGYNDEEITVGRINVQEDPIVTEEEALLQDLFMYDLHGPAVALQRRASVKSPRKEKARVKFDTVTSHKDDISEEEIVFRDEEENAALLRLAQRQEEQMRVMIAMSEQISQMMQVLKEKDKSKDDSPSVEQLNQ